MKKVLFSDCNDIMKIPSIEEYDIYIEHLWWTKKELSHIRSKCIKGLKLIYKEYPTITLKEAIKILN